MVIMWAQVQHAWTCLKIHLKYKLRSTLLDIMEKLIINRKF